MTGVRRTVGLEVFDGHKLEFTWKPGERVCDGGTRDGATDDKVSQMDCCNAKHVLGNTMRSR